MKLTANSSQPLNVKADLLVIGHYKDNKPKSPLLDLADQELEKEISQILQKEELSGKVGEAKLIRTASKLKADYILIIGLGSQKDFTLEILRKTGSTIHAVAKQIKASTVACSILGADFKNQKSADCAQALSEGILLAGYQFTKYLKATPSPIKEVIMVGTASKDLAKTKKAVSLAETLCQGTALARDLVNIPSNDMTPLELAKVAKDLPGVTTKIHNMAAIKKMKMGAFLSVAQGSTMNPACFIEIHYKPKSKAKKQIAIVGKGVTFDTGGYSLKPPKAQENMKDDMAGSAAVLGLMSIISALQPRVEVRAYIAATENMVDGFAQKPGDICTAMDGTTIEVLNTDAEGRLTLADALHYANQREPDYMIDLATLTGACLVALGLQYTGALGNDQPLLNKLIASGEQTGEKLWQLPLAPEYKSLLKSPIADLKNIGGPYGGTITAGLFLEHFVGKTKWAHLDIAGPSWADGSVNYVPKGGSGVMVRTLATFLKSF